MLKAMRDQFKHLKIFLWLVVISFVLLIFVGWGVQGRLGGRDRYGKQAVAAVDNQAISAQQYQRALRNRIDYIRRLNPDRFDEDLLRSMGIENQVLDALIQEKIAMNLAADMGIMANPGEIQDAIINNPAFQDENGFVGGEMVEKYLRRRKIEPSDYMDDLGENIVLSKYRGLVMDSVIVTDEEVRQEYIRRNDKAQLEYVFISPAGFVDGGGIPKSELRKYYDSHKDRYQNHQRMARFVLFDNKAFEKEVTLTDEELWEYFQQNQARYEERRSASHVLIAKDGSGVTEEKSRQLLEKAMAVAERARNGEDFAALAKQMSDDTGSKDKGGALGAFGRGKMVPEFEDAVFAMEEGEIVGPIESRFGYHIIKLTGIIPGRPFEEVKESIKTIQTANKAREMSRNAALEASLKFQESGDLDALAAEYELETKSTGYLNPDDTRFEGIVSNHKRFIEQLFKLEPGKISAEPLAVGTSFAVLKFEEEKGPVTRPFAEVIDRVAAHQRTEALAECMGKAGSELSACVDELKLQVKTSSEFLRNGYISPDLRNDPAIQKKAFRMKVGEGAGPFEVNDGVAYVRLTKRFEFTDDGFKEQAQAIKDSLESQLRYRFLTALQTNMQETLQQEGRVKVFLPNLGGPAGS